MSTRRLAPLEKSRLDLKATVLLHRVVGRGVTMCKVKENVGGSVKKKPGCDVQRPPCSEYARLVSLNHRVSLVCDVVQNT